MAAYIPPGWPTGVHPPGSDDFEATAIAWLLDVVPPDFRLHGVLRRHPAALAAMARHHTQACVEGARAGYRTARTELGELLPPHAIDAVLAAYRAEGRRLANTAKAMVLIEEAIRGDTVLPARSRLCGRCSSGHVAPMGRMQLGVSATRTVDACMCATGPVATGPGCHKGRTFPGGKVRLREKLISV